MEWDTSEVPDPQDPADLRSLETGLVGARAAPPRRVAGPDQTADHHPAYLSGLHGSQLRPRDARCRTTRRGWLLLERGEMIMVVNFSDRPTEVRCRSSGGSGDHHRAGSKWPAT